MSREKRMIMRFNPFTLITIASLIFIVDVKANNWLDYGPTFESDSNEYITASTRDQEQEIYSPLITGYKYVSGNEFVFWIKTKKEIFEINCSSGGAGEGRQYLSPNGDIPNRLEVKTDEELPAFCNPPNPCPLGFEGRIYFFSSSKYLLQFASQ